MRPTDADDPRSDDQTRLKGSPLDAATGAPDPAQTFSAGTGTGPGPGAARTAGSSGPLKTGQDLGSRYHIIRLLGVGGMGAVYQAWDKTLEVAVAIKVIRPPETLSADEAQAAEKRFKRELLLARKVTHTNVVRIHDIGEIDGITYITMPYVQGSDLSTLLKRTGRLPVERAVGIARQIAAGLVAAHQAGIVHRDLKPANIMVDADDQALIMDFGIARSTAAGFTMTAGNAVIGTIEYMAPEQARGLHVDQRADVYAFGLIVRDMLLGGRQSTAGTSVAELMERMQKAPVSVRSVDPTIPADLDALITKCLQPNPDDRYASIAEALADLGGRDRATSASAAIPVQGTSTAPALPSRAAAVPRWAIAAIAVLLLGTIGWLMRDRFWNTGTGAPTAVGPAVSVAILPFRNDSGDPTLDSIGAGLSEVLRTQLGESAQLRTVPADRVHRVLADLRIAPNARLASADVARIAEFTSAKRVLWGSITSLSDQIRIDVTLQDLERGSNASTPLAVQAVNRTSPALLAAIGDLAGKVRTEIARGSTEILAELEATSWKPSTTSFDALRLYNEGLLLTRQGNHQEARARFEASTAQDREFALAYSALARSYASLRYDDEAGRFSRQAMDLAEGLQAQQEKYRVAANHYLITGKTSEAVAAYESLLKVSPNDTMVLYDLGGLYEQSGDYEKAEQYFTNVVSLDPKFVEGLTALGRVRIRRGNYEGSLEHLNAALTIAIRFNHDEARANILQAIGIAYKRMAKFDEALRHFQESLKIKRDLNNKGGMAGSLGEIAQIHEAQGRPAEAEASFKEALALQREIGDKSGQSVTLINLATMFQDQGAPDRALPLLREALQLRRETGNPVGISLVLNNIGAIYLEQGQFSEAQTYLEQALALREKTGAPGALADTLHNLAENSSKMGRYDDALKNYLRALDLRRTANDPRGAAIEQYSTGTIFDDQARYGAAVKAKAEALQTLREQKQRDRFLGLAMSGYGASLSLSGRMDTAATSLEEAIALARELKNPSLIATALKYQAERELLGGNPKRAAELADEAIKASATASDRALTLQTQATSAFTAAALQPTNAVAARLAQLSQEADSIGLRPLAVECSVVRAQTLLTLKNPAAARQEADRSLTRAETSGFRLLAARAHFVRAEALRAAKDPGARRAYQSALRILDEIKAEDGSQDVLKRADLGPMYTQAAQFAR